LLLVTPEVSYIQEVSKQNVDQKEGIVVKDQADLLTIREVAETLRVDDTTVRRWIKGGVLEAVALPHSGTRQAYRIRRTTLETLLASSSLTSL
jgi:excisionase family DNA binding protein